MEIRKVQPGLVWILNNGLKMDRYVDELASELDVSPQTVRRWCRGDSIPKTVVLALRFLLGELSHPDWQAAHVCDEGRLWVSNGYCFRVGELEYFQVIRQTNRALWRRLSKPADTKPTRLARAAID